MNKFVWVALLSLSFAQVSLGKEEGASREKIRELVKQFYLANSVDQYLASNEDGCEMPKKGECIRVACSKMPSYNCDDRSEIKEIAMACSNVDGGCIENVCNRMSNYSCDDTSEIKEIALACKGLLDSNCINVVCSKLSDYSCDSFSELKEVIDMCKNP